MAMMHETRRYGKRGRRLRALARLMDRHQNPDHYKPPYRGRIGQDESLILEINVLRRRLGVLV